MKKPYLCIFYCGHQVQIKMRVSRVGIGHATGHPTKYKALLAVFLALEIALLRFGITDMASQVREVKRAAEQVAQLRRVGKGLGVYEFDRQIQG